MHPGSRFALDFQLRSLQVARPHLAQAGRNCLAVCRCRRLWEAWNLAMLYDRIFIASASSTTACLPPSSRFMATLLDCRCNQSRQRCTMLLAIRFTQRWGIVMSSSARTTPGLWQGPAEAHHIPRHTQSSPVLAQFLSFSVFSLSCIYTCRSGDLYSIL